MREPAGGMTPGQVLVALPYDLVRSRPPGQRARALWRLAAFSMLLLAGVFAGAASTVLLG